MKILICGSGLVGLAAGYKLKKNNKVTIIEKKEQIPYQKKTMVLNYRTINYLCQSLELNNTPIYDLVIAKYGNILRNKLHSNNFDLPYFGSVYNSEELTKTLYEECKDLIKLSTSYSPVMKEQYDLVIACDGTYSDIRKNSGINANFIEYDRKAIVLSAKGTKLTSNTAYEFFVKDHTIAVLPNTESTLKIVILAPSTSILHKANEKQLLRYINNYFHLRMGRIEVLKKLSSYPFIGMKSDSLVEDNIVLLGNSASSVSPVAAQGFNLAIADLKNLEFLLKNDGDLNLYNTKRHKIHEQYFSYINNLETKHKFLPDLGYELGFLALNTSEFLSRKLVNWGTGFYA